MVRHLPDGSIDGGTDHQRTVLAHAMADEEMFAMSDGVAGALLNTQPRRNSLYDATRWTDADGFTWLLEDMRPSHRRNLLRMLTSRAESIAYSDAIAWLSSPIMNLTDNAPDDAFEWQIAHAAEWLAGTPLVKRLAELVALDEASATAGPDWWDE